MTTLITTFLRKNFNLVLLLSATVCIALALGEVFRGGTWSLLLPVSMTAVVCSWILGASRLTAQTDGKGQRTTFGYDALDRKTSKTTVQ